MYPLPAGVNGVRARGAEPAKAEARRKDPNDHPRAIVQDNRSAHNLPIGGEARPPHLMAQNGHLSAAAFGEALLFREERTPKGKPDTESREEGGAGHAYHFSARLSQTGESHLPGPVDRHVLESGCALTQGLVLLELHGVSIPVHPPALGLLKPWQGLEDGDELARVAEGGGVEEHVVEDAEHGGGGADPQAERGNRYCREGGTPSQRAQGGAYILPHGGQHRISFHPS